MAKALTLKAIPEDVFKLIQKEQNEIRALRGTNQFSLESTIYKMLRDYEKCRKASNFKPEE